MNLGEKIKSIRESRSLLQGDLAKETGISQAAISQFEKGVRRPTPVNIKKIAKALGVDEQTFAENQDYEQAVLLRSIKGLNDTDLKKVNEFIDFIKFSKDSTK